MPVKVKSALVTVAESVPPAWRAKGKTVWPDLAVVGFGRTAAVEDEVDEKGALTGRKAFKLGCKQYAAEEIVFTNKSANTNPNITADWADHGWAPECFRKLNGHFSVIVADTRDWSAASVDTAAFLLESKGALIVKPQDEAERVKVTALINAHDEFLPVTHPTAMIFYRV